jgi:hypothetical protein
MEARCRCTMIAAPFHSNSGGNCLGKQIYQYHDGSNAVAYFRFTCMG